MSLIGLAKGLRDRVTEALRVFWRDVKFARALVSGKPLILYVGWVGFGNLGDEILFQAHVELFPNYTLLPFDRLSAYRLLLRLPPLKSRLVAGLLGGGTLINLSSSYLKNLELIMGLGLPVFSMGTGVNFQTAGDRLPDRWQRAFKKLIFLGVRGPVSHKILKNSGLRRAVVVGDTALSLTDYSRQPRAPAKLIGVCVGHSRQIPLPVDSRAFRSEICDFITQAINKGYKVVLLPVWSKDLAYNQSIIRQVNSDNCFIVKAYRNFDEYFAQVGACSVFVSQKLHAGVLSTMALVPTVMIAYHSKCRDFMDSVGKTKNVLDITKFNSRVLSQHIDRLPENSTADRLRLKTRLKAYRSRQLLQARKISAELSLTGKQPNTRRT